MGVILLVRHGQASWGAADYDQLSEQGRRQSEVVGRVLAERGPTPTRVVAGRMRRHSQTVQSLVEAARWDATVEVDAGWDEFDHVQMLQVHGPPDGSSPDQLSRQEFNAWFDAATRRWTSGEHDDDYDEPFHAFTGRVEAAFRDLARSLGEGGRAVVVSSGGPVSWVAATLLGGGLDAWVRLNPVCVNAALTKVVVGARGTTLVSWNDHGHLEPDLVTYR